MAVRENLAGRVFDAANVLFMVLLSLLMTYPMLFILFGSISDPAELIASGGVLWLPRGFNLRSYAEIARNGDIVSGYGNTLFYVAAGTALNTVLSLVAGYALSRRWLFGSRTIMFLLVLTMFFSGGLIPSYLVVRSLGLYNSRWALILPAAVGTYNVILIKTYFASVPDSMEESAKIDGANDLVILARIMSHLAAPVIAVVVLFNAVWHWNSWFAALIYLKDRGKYPLQLFLREILVQSQTRDSTDAIGTLALNIKYATIIVSTLPILLAYPFLQKYFVKGIMIGAVKG